MISLDLTKSLEVRKAGDQPNSNQKYLLNPQNITMKTSAEIFIAIT